MKYIKYSNVIIAAILILFFMSCQRGQESASTGNEIALVMKTLNNPFFIDMKKGAEDAAKELKIDLLVQAAEREVDVEKQMQIIENLIQRKVAAICVTPSGSKEIIPAIIKANKANIPVLVVDTRVDIIALEESGGKISTFIGSDNVEGGRIAGKYIATELKGKGKIAILEGIPGHETGDARLRGFHEEIAKYKEVEIVSSQTANWERDQGFNVFQNILQTFPDVQALFACNDMMALGAIEAITAADKSGQILVVGFDAVTDGRIAIKEGRMTGSVAQHPYEMGKISVESAHKVIKGQSIPSEIPVKINLITKTNLN